MRQEERSRPPENRLNQSLQPTGHAIHGTPSHIAAPA